MRRYFAVAFCVMVGSVYGQGGGLSGAIKFGAETPAKSGGAGETPKVINATGIGLTLDAAEKQALAAAIRQAVGAYIDANTLVQNEQVIRDRILTVSSAFVEKYEVVGKPTKNADGLFEISITATVKSNQVMQVLKENNILKGDVAGQNLWAEATSKIANANDAVAFLEAKIPEMIKQTVKVIPLNNEGNPKLLPDGTTPDLSPYAVKSDPATGKAKLLWLVELDLDRKAWETQVVPPVAKCLEAISGEAGKEVRVNTHQSSGRVSDFLHGTQNLRFSFNRGSVVEQIERLPETLKLRLGKQKSASDIRIHSGDNLSLLASTTKSKDSGKFLIFDRRRAPIIETRDADLKLSGERGTYGFIRHVAALSMALVDSSGEEVVAQSFPVWSPFGREHPWGLSSMWNELPPVFYLLGIEVDANSLKDIKRAKLSLEVPPVKVSLPGAR